MLGGASLPLSLCTSEGTLPGNQEVLLSDIHSISLHSYPVVLSVLNKGNLTLSDTQEKLTKGREPVSWRAYGRYVISVSKRITGRKKKERKSSFISLEWVAFTC